MLSLLKLLFVVFYIFKISGEFTAAGIWIGYLPLYLIQFFFPNNNFFILPIINTAMTARMALSEKALFLVEWK